MPDKTVAQENAGTPIQDAHLFRAVQNEVPVKLTFAQVKAWTKAWIVKADVGLGNVDNTSDADKPITTAQGALNATFVVGPAAAVDGTPAVFDTTTGKLIKNIPYATFKTSLVLVKGDVALGNVDNTSDANKPVSTAQAAADALKVTKAGDTMTGALTLSGDPSSALHAATKQYVDGIVTAQDAFVSKGGINASTNPNFPAADAGWTYRITAAGKVGGASGPNVEVGDIIQCFVDGSAAGTQAAVGANWVILQTNIDGAVTLTGTQTLSGKTLTTPVINSPTGIVKGDVGLGNVDNTSDVNKPVSTAQATADALKVTKAGDTMTGLLTLSANPSNPLHAATKQYVDAVASSGLAAIATGKMLANTSGASAVPVATDIPVLHKQVFTTTGTFTTPANSSTATIYEYEITGGGGGGGGATVGACAAGGGGAGETAIGTFTGIAPSTNITITIGAAGAAGTNAGGTGGTGGQSSIGTPVTVTANGGAGGASTTTPGAGGLGGAGGSGGTGTGATSIPGGMGNIALLSPGNFVSGGNGGGSYWGGGGGSQINGPGFAATAYGGGGGGASGASAAQIGGAGKGGIGVITWVL